MLNHQTIIKEIEREIEIEIWIRISHLPRIRHLILRHSIQQMIEIVIIEVKEEEIAQITMVMDLL